MADDSKARVRKHTLGELQQQFSEDGVKNRKSVDTTDDDPDLAIAAKDGVEVDQFFFKHLRPENGKKVRRTVSKGVDNIKYWSYDPPSFWHTQHQIMRVEVKSAVPDRFFYHDGEEILIPISGPGIEYDFIWARPGKAEHPHIYPESPRLVRPGGAIRVNPQIPHRARSAKGKDGEKKTDAWMITRPLANTAAQVYVSFADHDYNQSSSRQVLADDTTLRRYKEKPGHFPLISWGIGEAIRSKRLRSGYSLKNVADNVGIDEGVLSRIENGKTNVALTTLENLFLELDIDGSPLLIPPVEVECLIDNYRSNGSDILVAPLFPQPDSRYNYVDDPIPPRVKEHFLHLQIWKINENESISFLPDSRDNRLPDGIGMTYKWTSSWIVTKGRLVVDLSYDNQSKTGKQQGPWKRSVLLYSGSVFHLREGVRLEKFSSLEECELIQLISNPYDCYCDQSETVN